MLLLTSGMLAYLKDPQRMPPGKLPGAQDHFALCFEIEGLGVSPL